MNAMGEAGKFTKKN